MVEAGEGFNAKPSVRSVVTQVVFHPMAILVVAGYFWMVTKLPNKLMGDPMNELLSDLEKSANTAE
jgi:hypothetical protein